MNQMTLKKSVILTILFGLITGCSEKGPLATTTSSPSLSLQAALPGPAAKLAWQLASTTWSDLCIKINIETQDAFGLATNVTTDTTVTLATTAAVSILTFYSDSSCATSLTGAFVVLPLGTSSKNYLYEIFFGWIGNYRRLSSWPNSNFFNLKHGASDRGPRVRSN